MKKNIQKTKLQSSTLATKPFSFEQHIHWFLMLGALILYGWTYTFDFGLDDSYITGQLAKIGTGFNDFLSIFTRWYDGSDYRPITIVFFWLERKLFGEISPDTSHLINAIFYGFLLIQLYKIKKPPNYLEAFFIKRQFILMKLFSFCTSCKCSSRRLTLLTNLLYSIKITCSNERLVFDSLES